MRQALLKEAAAKRLLDGSLTRLTSYGSCNLLVPLATALSARTSGGGGPAVAGVGVTRSNSAGAAAEAHCGTGLAGSSARWSADGVDGSGGGGNRGTARASEPGLRACAVLGLVPSAGSDAVPAAASALHAASAPASPVTSPRMIPGAGRGSGAAAAAGFAAAALVQPLVGSHSGHSAHEYFDNW
jgi:hypothetical protein